MDKIDTVKLDKLEKIIKNIKDSSTLESKDIDLSFEFICASLFPDVFNNIKNVMTKQYIEGYESGQNLNIDYFKWIDSTSNKNIYNILEYLKLCANELGIAFRKIKEDSINEENQIILERQLSVIEYLISLLEKICIKIVGEE